METLVATISNLELRNLDLLSVAITVAGIGILGFVIFFSNPRSITGRAFLAFALITVMWGISNYLDYQLSSREYVLWLLRLHLFISVWHAFFIFRLLYVFPEEQMQIAPWHNRVLLPVVIVVSIMTLTPLVFSGISASPVIGQVVNPERGFGIVVFAALAVFLIISSVIGLIRKALTSFGERRRQYSQVLMGVALTFVLIISFNIILPIFFDNLRFIPLGAVFILPFVAFTFYAIRKHHLLNVKVVATEVLTFLLSVVTFVEVVFSTNASQILFRSGIFVLVLAFGILLIRSVVKEIEQRVHIEKLAVELEKANERLKALDRLKDEFLSFATHQIRAPLTAIKGYSSLILEGDYGQVSDGVKDAADKILTSSSGMTVMVDNFLNISKIEQGVKFELAELDFAKMADQAAGELLPNIERKGLHLEKKIAPNGSCKVMADTGWLKQVIVNLIDNSIKYTDHGSIRVIVERVGDKVRFAVKDTGAGMSPDTIGTLFQKFSRSSGAKVTNAGGSGIGLYLAKLIVEGHKGRVWAESDGPGKGSQFIVELPVLD